MGLWQLVRLVTKTHQTRPNKSRSKVTSTAGTAPAVPGSEIEGLRKQTNWWRETFDEKVSVQERAIHA